MGGYLANEYHFLKNIFSRIVNKILKLRVHLCQYNIIKNTSIHQDLTIMT